MHYIFFPKLNTPIFYINFYHKESIYININHMRASSDQEYEAEINLNGSLNETANSIHIQHSQLDRQMSSLDECLKQFIKSQLIVGIRLDSLEDQQFLATIKHSTIKPVPWVYFLPHSIILHEKSIYGNKTNMIKLRDQIANLQKEGYSTAYCPKINQISIKVHNSSQLTFYNIRPIKSDFNLHQKIELLDHKYLIDKLYEYYQNFYQSLMFKETSILILYWAHQKQLFDDEITEHIIKLLIICIFINFGYGVANIVHQHSVDPQKIKQFKKMHSYSQINKKGETQIEKELISKFTNYTILQKKGFYMTSQQRYMSIKDIIPIYFPILPLQPSKEQAEKDQIQVNLKVVLKNQKEQMSICKNISKIFKFLHNKFEKRMRLVVDFTQKLAYRHQFSQTFQIQILHPVLNTNIIKLKQSSLRKMKNEIKSIVQNFNQSKEAAVIIKEMFCNNRSY